MGNVDRHNWKKAYAVFIAIFFCICIIVLTLLISDKRSFVRDGDAYTQHYPAFLYIGRWYRDAVRALLIHHELPKLWDFSIGYGADVANTLYYYCMFDFTTSIFAVFSNEQNGYWLYTAMMLVRTFLCGIAFIAYCKKMKCAQVGAILASFAYMLCPYMLDNVFNGHHFFALPLLYFPIILIICEKIIGGEKILLFAPIITLFVAGSVYYFYMVMIFVAFYIPVRYLCRYKKVSPITGLIKVYVRFAGVVVIGLIIAMPVLFPEIYALLGDARITVRQTVPLFYDSTKYSHAVDNFVILVLKKIWN